MRFQADLGGHIRNILIPTVLPLLLRTGLHLIKFIAFDLITFDAAGAPIIGGLWSFRYIYGISGRKTNSFSFINNVAPCPCSARQWDGLDYVTSTCAGQVDTQG